MIQKVSTKDDKKEIHDDDDDDNRNNNTSINDDEISFDNVEIEVSIINSTFDNEGETTVECRQYYT